MSQELLQKHRREIRIMVADNETLMGDRLSAFLKSNGFDVVQARSATDVLIALNQFQPHIIIYDLMFSELNAISLLKQLKSAGHLDNDKMRVIVVSHHNNPANVRECLRLGAVDFLAKPLKPNEILGRVVFHLQTKREVADYRPAEKDRESAQYFLYLIETMLRECNQDRPVDQVLFRFTQLVSMTMKSVRVSVIRCDSENRKGEVVASSDKADINRLALDLVKYPEVLYVLRNQKILALDNIAADPTMHFLAKTDKSVTFHSMAVAPIRINQNIWGVLSIRMPEAKQRITDFEIRLCEAMAGIAAMIVLRDPTIKTLLHVPVAEAS